MKRLILLLFALPALGQNFQLTPPICWQKNCYTATTGNVSLSGSGTKATIQQPAQGPYQRVYGIKATVNCSVACIVTRITGGTPATVVAHQIAITQSPYMPTGAATPLMLFFDTSDATGGKIIDQVNVGAGTTQVYDLSDVVFGTNPQQTYSISVSSITGTANITFYVALE